MKTRFTYFVMILLAFGLNRAEAGGKASESVYEKAFLKSAIEFRAEALKKMLSAAQKVEAEIERRIIDSRRERTEIFREFYDREISDLEEESLKQDAELTAAVNQFIAKYPKSDKTPDALLKLAQIYFDSASKEHRKEIKAFYEASQTEDGVKSFPQKNLYPAIKTLERIEKDFPKYERLDLVLYLLGFAHISGERGDNAEPVFQKLVTLFPNSPFSEEAFLRLGEHYFAQRVFNKAIDSYKKVTAYPGRRFYDKALYKLAWSYYITRRYTEAVDSFIKLLDYTAPGERSDPFLEEFKRDAELYVAFSLYRKNDLSQALAFVRSKSGRPYAYDIQKNLADIYLDRDMYKEAVFIYRDILASHPLKPSNPAVHNSLVRSLELLYAESEIRKERRKIIQSFSPESEWRTANKGDAYAIAEADGLLENNLYALAITLDKHARKTGNTGHMNEAIELYSKLVGVYPKSEKSYNAQFYAAEANLYLNKLDRAIEAYDSVMKNNYYSRYYDEALYSEIVVYERMVDMGRDMPKWASRAKENPQEPIPPLAAKLLAACDHFLEKAPQDPRTPRVIYRSGEILARLNRPEKALERFEKVIAMFPADRYSQDSFRQILNINIERENWDGVINLGEGYLAKPFFTDKVLKEEVHKILAVANFKVGQGLGAQNRHIESADHLRMVAKKYTDTEAGQSALALAFDNYTKSSVPAKAKEGLKALLEEHPQNPLTASILLELAKMEEDALNFTDARDYYSRALVAAQSAEIKGAALLRAAVLCENTEQYEKAAEKYMEYARHLKDTEIVKEALLKAAVNYSKAGRLERIESYGIRPENVLKSDFAKIAMYDLLLAQSYLDKGNRKGFSQRMSEAQKSVKRAKAAGKEIYDLMYSLVLKDVEGEMKRFFEIGLVFPRDKFLSSFEKKALLMGRLESTLMPIIRSAGLKPASQAIYFLGRLYEDMGDALLKVALPDDLSSEERLQTEAELKKMADPLATKARSAYMKNISLSKSRKFYSKWIEVSTERFANMIQSESILRNLKLDFKYSYQDDLFYYPILEEPLKIESGQRVIGRMAITLFNDAVKLALKKRASRKDLESALSLFEQAHIADTDLIEAKFNRAVLLHNMGEYDKARLLYRSLSNSILVNEQVKINLAALSLADGNTSAPYQIYRDYLKNRPEDGDIRANLAFVLRKSEKLEDSLKESLITLENNPMHERSYNNAAMVYMLMGKRETAGFIFTKGIEAHPQSALLRKNLGALYLEASDFENAMTQFSLAKAINSDDVSVDTNLAYILFKTQNYEEGFNLAKQLWDGQGNKEPNLYINLGLAYMSMEKKQEAAEHIESNIRFAGPYYKEARSLISKISSSQGGE